MSVTKKCPSCAEEIQAEAVKCKHCKEFVGEANPQNSGQMSMVDGQATGKSNDVLETEDGDGFSNVLASIRKKKGLGLKSNVWMISGWFAAANGAVVLSLAILTGFSHASYVLGVVALVLGCVFPFGALLLSKYFAIKSHDMRLIKQGNFADGTEERVYLLVKSLADKAGIERTPEVGIYESPELNAFATGFNRNNSLVAFSSALLQRLDDDEVAAVAAHEVAHVANGDMVTMSIVQGVVNAVVMLVNIPLSMAQWWARQDNKRADFFDLGLAVVRFALVTVMVFLGNLLMKWFSRLREFKADEMAAKLVDHRSMIGALQALQANAEIELPREMKEARASYSSFKISAPPAAFDLFSTHPATERRISRLESLAGGAAQ